MKRNYYYQQIDKKQLVWKDHLEKLSKKGNTSRRLNDSIHTKKPKIDDQPKPLKSDLSNPHPKIDDQPKPLKSDLSNPHPKKGSDDVNAYTLTLTNKSSFHPRKFLRRSIKKEPFFAIHCLSPSKLHRLERGFVVTAVCDNDVEFESDEVKLELDAGLIANLKKYWPCLNKNHTFEQFMKYQMDKHGSRKRFEGDFIVMGLNLGKFLIDKIQIFFGLYGYNKEGEKINCFSFLDQLDAYLGVKTHVVFEEDRIIKGCFHLISIVALYNSALIAIDYDIVEECRRITETSYFVIEDLTKWLRSKPAKGNQKQEAAEGNQKKEAAEGNQKKEALKGGRLEKEVHTKGRKDEGIRKMKTKIEL